MTYVKINDNKYPASISTRMADSEWDNRATITAMLEMTHDEIAELFVDNVEWSIVYENTSSEFVYDEEGNIKVDEEGKPIMEEKTVITEQNCNDYCVAGDITDYRNGMFSITMGRPTDLEDTLEMLLCE